MIEGGIQENGRRAGTENVPGIVGMGKAAELALNELPERVNYIVELEKKLTSGILERIKNVHLTGHPENRIPGHASFCFEFVEGESMLLLLSAAGIEGASGSTCSSHDLKASHVLLAIGLGDLLAQGSLIFSLGKNNTIEEVDTVLDILPPIIDKLRSMSPVDEHFKYDKEAFKGQHHHH
jgi:cysteine desulfurase